MISIIIYCFFCYFAELGIMIGSRKFTCGSFVLAPIMFPIELGIILGKNFVK